MRVGLPHLAVARFQHLRLRKLSLGLPEKESAELRCVGEIGLGVFRLSRRWRAAFAKVG